MDSCLRNLFLGCCALSSIAGCDKVWGGFAVPNAACSGSACSGGADLTNSDGFEPNDLPGQDLPNADLPAADLPGTDLPPASPAVIAVGQAGVIVRRAPGETFKVDASKTTVSLQRVHGSSYQDVWAVGGLDTKVYWNGSAWTMTTFGNKGNLRSIFFSGATAGWIGGNSGVLQKRIVSGWVDISLGTSGDVAGLWALPGTQTVWAILNTTNGAGAAGNLLLSSTDGFGSLESTPLAATSIGVYQKMFGLADGTLLLVGGQKITHIKNRAVVFSTQLGSTNNLRGVWASGPTDLWAVGAAGVVLHANTASGSADWQAVPVGTSENLNDVYGTGPNDVWVVGEKGVIKHWNGSVWSTEASATTEMLLGVWTGL